MPRPSAAKPPPRAAMPGGRAGSSDRCSLIRRPRRRRTSRRRADRTLPSRRSDPGTAVGGGGHHPRDAFLLDLVASGAGPRHPLRALHPRRPGRAVRQGLELARLMAGWQLSTLDVARLFGVTRQAVQQWLEDGAGSAAAQAAADQPIDRLARTQPAALADCCGGALRRRRLRRAVDARVDRRRSVRRARRVGRAVLRLGERRVAVRSRHVTRSGRFVRVASGLAQAARRSFAAVRGGGGPHGLSRSSMCARPLRSRAPWSWAASTDSPRTPRPRPDRRPVLIETDVPSHRAVDVVTEAAVAHSRSRGPTRTIHAVGRLHRSEPDGSARPPGRTANVDRLPQRSPAEGRRRRGVGLVRSRPNNRLAVSARRAFDDWFSRVPREP